VVNGAARCQVLTIVVVSVVLLGREAVWTCGKVPTFRRNVPLPSSGSEGGGSWYLCTVHMHLTWHRAVCYQ
jgi:hypothetical protein